MNVVGLGEVFGHSRTRLQETPAYLKCPVWKMALRSDDLGRANPGQSAQRQTLSRSAFAIGEGALSSKLPEAFPQSRACYDRRSRGDRDGNEQSGGRTYLTALAPRARTRRRPSPTRSNSHS